MSATLSSTRLFSAVRFGAVEAANRVVMAPLTRLRAELDGTPNALMVEQYRQRAGVGMIVAEGTWPVIEGRTWYGQPGIATAEHVVGWRKVTDAVHAEGGRIALQIMHGGRISHPEITGTGRIVAPSAVAAPNPIRISTGKVDAPLPHALSVEEIDGVVADFVAAAERAMDAGFDAVQIHGANGYLIHQFFSPSSNLRSDEYGGTPERRARLGIEVTRAVAAAIGADRTGIRVSPEHNVQGAVEQDHDDVAAAYRHFAESVADLGLSHIDVLHAEPGSELVQSIRSASRAPLIANTGFAEITTLEEAARLVGEDVAAAVSVGRAVIANPDLVRRWETGAALNEPRPETFYTGGARGYTDYPSL
ncbi:MAG: alkene reductase [Micrococcus sp.]|nr:alkene reductase [Micrococcus sp.]